MAPPTRLRPHLNDLLQKNLELEHIVADLRHQLTQSSAKWAEERKMLAVGCDTLMASFAKFRARLDSHPSDWGDSEGEVERNLDAGPQGEETVEVDRTVVETAEGDQELSVVDHLRERCHALAIELQIKEEELEDSRRKREAAEEELQRVQQSLEAQSEQLRTALAPAKPDADNNLSPECLSDDLTAPSSPSQLPEGVDLHSGLDLANHEINRHKKLLQEWQRYGSDWKRDAQIARSRETELQLQLNAQARVIEESRSGLDMEKKEVQRVTSALADRTAELERQHTAYQKSEKRVHELEGMVALLRAKLSPEQLTTLVSGRTQAAEPLNLTRSPTPHTDTNANKRSDMIMLKIPYISAKRSSGANNGSQEGQQNQAPATTAISLSPAPQTSNNIPIFNSTDVELCIHTCNPFPCRNESQSFLWPRKQASLPRHAVSTKKHRRCTPDCPGHRLLAMPVADALREPRRVKCRPPTEVELALAAEESKRTKHSESVAEKRDEGEKEMEPEGLGEPEGPEESDDGSAREEEVGEGGEGLSPRNLGKRLRSRLTDGEESLRARKLRPRMLANTKS